MFRLYLDTLFFNLSLAGLVVVAVHATAGYELNSQDFVFPAAIVFLLTTLVFFLRDLLRLHDARIAARALAQRTAAQLAIFKIALSKQAANRPEILERF